MNSIVNPTSYKNNWIGRKKLRTKLFTSSNESLSKNIKLTRVIVAKGLTQLVIEKETTSLSTSQMKALINLKHIVQQSEDNNENQHLTIWLNLLENMIKFDQENLHEALIRSKFPCINSEEVLHNKNTIRHCSILIKIR